MTDALTTLSRLGWDRAGVRRDGRWEFRHAGTGDVVDIAPGEVDAWAAELVPPQTGDGEWYVESLALLTHLVKRRDGRGRPLLFERIADAEACAARLNERDSVTQETFL